MNQSLRTSAAHVFVDDITRPELYKEDAAHLSKSLRLRDGETVSVADGRGAWRLCAWRTGEGLEIIGDVSHETHAGVPLAVVISPVKGDRTDVAVEKMTEIGIDEIFVLSPVRRSVVRWDERKFVTNIERLGKIARGAAMQSRRVYLPRVIGPVTLTAMSTRTHSAIADPGGTSDLSDVHTIVIGPEGGFDIDEYPADMPVVSLGEGVLRAETAAIVAATLMVAHRARRSDHTG